jgi:hypothetical protein
VESTLHSNPGPKVWPFQDALVEELGGIVVTVQTVPAQAQKYAKSLTLTKSIARSALFGALWMGMALFDTSFLVIDFHVGDIKTTTVTSVPVDTLFPREMPTHSTAKPRNSIPWLN